jgi:hypothetical protein
MGREIKRVPMDFSFPIGNGTWSGYVMPESLHENPCPEDCNGYSKYAKHLKDLWYGHAPFKPEDNGSTPFLPEHPAIRKRAEWNVERAPEYYGTGEAAIAWEATRLAKHFNNGWLHHLNQDDVDALLAEDRLRDFTHTFDSSRPPAERWQPIEPPVHPTAAQVNEWSIGFGSTHDGINSYVVCKARCEREGVPYSCHVCDGHGSFEAYPGQRAEAEAWERTEPPEGEGWQLWQTVSDGPISPVYATPEELARWMASPAYTWGASQPMKYKDALAFITGPGWAPSAVRTASHGVETGEQHAARTELAKNEESE